MNKKKLLINTLKVVRVISWIISFFGFAVGVICFFGEPSEEIGAGIEFLQAMLLKTLIAIVCFIVAALFYYISQKISQLFQECGIK